MHADDVTGGPDPTPSALDDSERSGRPTTPATPIVVAIVGIDPGGIAAAVQGAGGVVGPLDEADAAVFLRGGPYPELPDRVRWVQLASAGVERFLADGIVDRRRVWTSAVGAYADTVAEHAVALLLAGVRGLVTASRLESWQPAQVAGQVRGLRGATVTIVGAGGIGRRVAELLTAFGATVIAVNRSGQEVPEAARTVPSDQLGSVWAQTDHVVVAAPATAQTRGIIDASVLSHLKPTTWIVNVGRGSLIDTDALVEAVSAGRIAGAALDVTDPEPLPDGHPLWHTPGILITPHTANPREHQREVLAQRVADNLRLFAHGRPLIGVVNLDAGY